MFRFLLAVFFASGVLAPSVVRAQACHGSEPLSSLEREISLRLRTTTATFRTERYEGHYQALAAGAELAVDRFAAGVTAPYYRLLRNGLAEQGPGDLALELQVTAVGSGEEILRGGVDLGAMLPTGDAEAELGMGHVMLMPGIWAQAVFDQVVVSGQLSYAFALAGEAAHAHHEGPHPLVDPMNASELEPSFFATFRATEVLELRGGGYAGLPIAVDGGEARAAALAGVGIRAARLFSRVEGHVPLAGDAFTAKLAVELGVRF